MLIEGFLNRVRMNKFKKELTNTIIPMEAKERVKNNNILLGKMDMNMNVNE